MLNFYLVRRRHLGLNDRHHRKWLCHHEMPFRGVRVTSTTLHAEYVNSLKYSECVHKTDADDVLSPILNPVGEPSLFLDVILEIFSDLRRTDVICYINKIILYVEFIIRSVRCNIYKGIYTNWVMQIILVYGNTESFANKFK